MTIDTGATVWVVMGIVPYEVQAPLRVFQSRDEAETYRSSLELRHERYVTAKFEYYERVSELAQEAMNEEELQEAVGDAPRGVGRDRVRRVRSMGSAVRSWRCINSSTQGGQRCGFDMVCVAKCNGRSSP